MSFKLEVIAALIAASAWLAPASGQSSAPLDYLPGLKGGYFFLDSAAAKHRYHIYVRLPEDYEANTNRRYPVVYVLDGDSLFPILATNHLFLTYDDKLPEAVVVGIAYGSFEPPVNARRSDFGERSAAFQTFLRSELLPKVESRYRADPARRILIGQSHSGGFVLYSAYSDPDLFWGRIASNPSFPDHRALLFGDPNRPTRSDLQLAVVTGTADRPPIRAGVVEWLKVVEPKTKPWAFKAIELQGGTHAADIPTAYRLGMRWMFAVTP